MVAKEDRFISFDEALAELQMATSELRALVSQGRLPVEGDGLSLNFKLDNVLELKKHLHDEPPALALPKPGTSGWIRKEGLIIWRGSAPENGWITLKTAPRQWDTMKFKMFFDARATLRKVGFAAGTRAFAVETKDPERWHSFYAELRNGFGKVSIDDNEIFAGTLYIPYIALCGNGGTELSLKNQDDMAFRGLKIERFE